MDKNTSGRGVKIIHQKCGGIVIETTIHQSPNETICHRITFYNDQNQKPYTELATEGPTSSYSKPPKKKTDMKKQLKKNKNVKKPKTTIEMQAFDMGQAHIEHKMTYF